jgi:hypothetical protein
VAAEFKVILIIDSQGNAKIEEVKRSLQEMGQTAEQASRGGTAAADDFAGALVRKLGIIALVTAGFYKLEQAAVGAFKAGLQAADDERVATIQVAASLTDLAQEGINSQTAYAQNIAYSRDMYSELQLAAARHFATGGEMIQAWNILAQKGIALRKEDIDNLGVIVDRIKLATQGQAQSIQIAQELRAMLSGQSRQTDQLAMILKDRYGAAWEEIVNKHRQAGDLLAWLAGEFKGLVAASPDILNTLNAQKATLTTMLSIVGREGLSGAYEWIVEKYKEGNEWLKNHREVAEDIKSTWKNIEPIAQSVLDIIIAMGWAAGKTAQGIAFIAGSMAKVNEAAKQMYTQDLWNAELASPEENISLKMERNLQLAKEAERYKKETFAIYAASLGPAPTKKGMGDTGGGGGKGIDSALNAMQSLMDRLNQDIARLSEGGRAAVDAWAVHTQNEIAKLVAKGADGAQALNLLDRAVGLKKMALDEEVYQHLAKESGIAYAAIEADSNKWLQKAGGNIEQVMALWDLKSRKEWEADVKNYSSRLGLEKGFYAQAADLAMNLADQINLRRQALEKELESHRYQLALQFNQLVVAKEITAAERDRFLANQALLDQQKRFNFEMENNKGLMGWAWSRAKEADQRNTLKDLLGGLESGFQSAFRSGLQGVLTHDKKTLKDIGATMWQGLIGEINIGGISRMSDAAARLWRSYTQADIGSGKGLDGGAQLSKAATGLQSAGGKFAVNAAQFGLAAGGLLLSGVGIMTNSQALVVAGTVLQMAGLAIQLYEALTATTAMTEFTEAAAALTLSAGALTEAAGALTLAAGGSEGGGILGGVASWVSDMFFHQGALIAHQGLLVAHEGLRPDERLIRAQAGEGIIKRSTMDLYRSRGITFEDLNSGRLPVVPAAAPVIINYSPSLSAIDARGMEALLEKHGRHLVKVINRQIGTRGQKLGDGRI